MMDKSEVPNQKFDAASSSRGDSNTEAPSNCETLNLRVKRALDLLRRARNESHECILGYYEPAACCDYEVEEVARAFATVQERTTEFHKACPDAPKIAEPSSSIFMHLDISPTGYQLISEGARLIESNLPKDSESVCSTIRGKALWGCRTSYSLESPPINHIGHVDVPCNEAIRHLEMLGSSGRHSDTVVSQLQVCGRRGMFFPLFKQCTSVEGPIGMSKAREILEAATESETETKSTHGYKNA